LPGLFVHHHEPFFAPIAAVVALTAIAIDPPERKVLASGVRKLARALADLARTPADRATRQQAADHALAVARQHLDRSLPSDSTLAALRKLSQLELGKNPNWLEIIKLPHRA
jgi:hypothetical protein